LIYWASQALPDKSGSYDIRVKGSFARFIGQVTGQVCLMNQATTVFCLNIVSKRLEMRAIKNIRLKNYDYSSNGFYFVTICTDYRRPYLAGKNKETILQCIEQLPQKMSGVKLDYYGIMPTHVHLILILEDCELKLSEIVRRLKAAVTKQIGFRLWQPNYYEHVIRNELSLAKIREYIQNNPLVEEIELKRFYEV
jgi:putative transposase